MVVECISCKVNVANDKGAVGFECPNCGKYRIVRCKKCRMIVAKYTCPSCGFIGPN